MLFLFFLIIIIAGTWVLAAIYVKHHEETNLWKYSFAGACFLQVYNVIWHQHYSLVIHGTEQVSRDSVTCLQDTQFVGLLVLNPIGNSAACVLSFRSGSKCI